MSQLFLIAAGISGGLAVITGAFGAHALKNSLTASMLSAYETAVQYQFIHTLALFALGILVLKLEAIPRLLNIAGIFWLVGLVLFCGSLYGLALGGPRWLGPITPLGGLFFILGWFAFATGAWQLKL